MDLETFGGGGRERRGHHRGRREDSVGEATRTSAVANGSALEALLAPSPQGGGSPAPAGDSESQWLGIVPRFMDEVFQRVSSSDTGSAEYTVRCSFIEIYQNLTRDLLNPSNAQQIEIRSAPPLYAAPRLLGTAGRRGGREGEHERRMGGERRWTLRVEERARGGVKQETPEGSGFGVYSTVDGCFMPSQGIQQGKRADPGGDGGADVKQGGDDGRAGEGHELQSDQWHSDEPQLVTVSCHLHRHAGAAEGRLHGGRVLPS